MENHTSVQRLQSPMVAEWSQKAIWQSGGKIGCAMVYEPTSKTRLWMKHAEKIHKNVEQLIYHLLQVARIFQPRQSRLTCYLARAFISLSLTGLLSPLSHTPALLRGLLYLAMFRSDLGLIKHFVVHLSPTACFWNKL